MVRADGLMLVGERQSRETVIQDCNSYIKVFETCHLLCAFQMPCLFNVDTENMPELLKRDLCKCKLFAELCLYKKEIEKIFHVEKLSAGLFGEEQSSEKLSRVCSRVSGLLRTHMLSSYDLI